MALSIPAVFLGWKGGKRREFRGRACFRPARVAEEQVAHSAGREKMEEIFRCLEGWAGESILCFLKPVEKSWQPHDLLPDSSNGDDGFFDRVKELRERARELPNDFFVCLVGNMVTEEALPTYQTFLNNLDGVRDETGASLSPWAVWTRAWTAEENRHGDLLKQYLFLSGRVDMRSVETTIQHLIACGMYVKTENSPYKGFIYTSFQERATFIAHRNTAREASRHGDASLARICGAVAADEKRHCAAYAAVVEKLFEIDPDGAVLALADMMRKGIVMPGHLMFDGRDHSLFHHLGQATSQLGIYTALDYADVIEYLLRRWKVESLAGLSGEGKAAQEFVCSLPPRIKRLHSINLRRSAALSPSSVPFSWIFDRHLQF